MYVFHISTIVKIFSYPFYGVYFNAEETEPSRNSSTDFRFLKYFGSDKIKFLAIKGARHVSFFLPGGLFSGNLGSPLYT